MNQFFSPASLPPIRILLRDRAALVVKLVYSMSIIDVQTEELFLRTKASIKRAILLDPVVFGEPECIRYGDLSQEIVRPVMLRHMSGRIRGLFVRQVSIPFTGSRELFDYAPSTMVYRPDDKGLLRPAGNRLIVGINLPFISARQAIAEAMPLAGLTMQFIASNNALAIPWSQQIGERLDYEIEKKREELLKLYGIR